MSILSDPRASFDLDHALILSQMHGFTRGTIFLYEKKGLHDQVWNFFFASYAWAKWTQVFVPGWFFGLVLHLEVKLGAYLQVKAKLGAPLW